MPFNKREMEIVELMADVVTRINNDLTQQEKVNFEPIFLRMIEDVYPDEDITHRALASRIKWG